MHFDLFLNQTKQLYKQSILEKLDNKQAAYAYKIKYSIFEN